MFHTLSEFPLPLGAVSTDSTRLDDTIAATLDMLDEMMRELQRRDDRGEWGAAGALAVLQREESRLTDALLAMRPRSVRPDVLDESTIRPGDDEAPMHAMHAMNELAPSCVVIGSMPDDPAAIGVYVDVDDAHNWADGCGEELPDDPEFEGQAFLQINERGNATLWEAMPLQMQTGPNLVGPLDWVKTWSVA